MPSLFSALLLPSNFTLYFFSISATMWALNATSRLLPPVSLDQEVPKTFAFLLLIPTRLLWIPLAPTSTRTTYLCFASSSSSSSLLVLPYARARAEVSFISWTMGRPATFPASSTALRWVSEVDWHRDDTSGDL